MIPLSTEAIVVGGRLRSMVQDFRINKSFGASYHFLPTVFISCALLLSNAVPAFSQFATTHISRREWGLKDPSRIEIVQVSVVKGEQGDSLLIYALRDTLPPAGPLRVVGRAPEGSGNYYVVSDFAYSQMNTLGGLFDSFQRAPSSSSAELTKTKDGDRALRLAYDKQKAGYCGLWMQLFNSFDAPANRVYLDSRPFSALSFWIRGETGREHITLRMADARWVQREDAMPIGDVGGFISGGRIDTTWREAVVPLDQIQTSINRAQLGSVVFEADSVGEGGVELKTLALCKDWIHTPPLKRAIAPEWSYGSQKAIWVWDTKSIISNGQGKSQFVDFLVQHNFTEVFLAIPYEPGAAAQSGSLPITHGALDSLIGALHSRSIRVDALLGDKNFALPEWHRYVVGTVRNVERFNSTAHDSERFDGVHLDVEPYLLPGFNGPRHQEFLDDYLVMLSEVRDQAHSSRLTLGADIPFWYSEPDEFTHTVSTVRIQGAEQPVYQRILDLVDNVAVMSYRTISSGTDGVVAHSLDEMTYAQQVGKTVFVGLETGPIADEQILTFRGRPQTGAIGSSQGDHLVMIPSGDSLAFFLFAGNQAQDFQASLRSATLSHGRIYHWSTNSSTTVPGTKLSFAALGVPEFNRTMKETQLELGQFKSFGGFAIHHYTSFRRLLDSASPSH